MAAASSEIRHALAELESAHEALSGVLRSLEGQERREALRACREFGLSAIDLAKLAGVSRQRIYELLED